MVFIPGGEFFRGRSQVLSDDNLKWYPTLMKDDRVAVLGRGTAVVEHANSEWIQAVVLNKCT